MTTTPPKADSWQALTIDEVKVGDRIAVADYYDGQQNWVEGIVAALDSGGRIHKVPTAVYFTNGRGMTDGPNVTWYRVDSWTP